MRETILYQQETSKYDKKNRMIHSALKFPVRLFTDDFQDLSNAMSGPEKPSTDRRSPKGIQYARESRNINVKK